MAEENKSGLLILSIVGIVAIISLVILFMGRSSVATPSESAIPEISEEQIEETSSGGDVVGQAYIMTKKGKYKIGYQKACWSCYDGYSECQGGSSSCKLSETWKQYAEQSCKGHGGKCSVNRFEVYSDCKDGYRKAHWVCYDGYEQWEGGETSCKSSETWQSYAKQSCEGHCQKTGVNSFSVLYACKYK